MKTPREIGHAIATAAGHCCFPSQHLATCSAITSAIETARADGLVAGFRTARAEESDSAAALEVLGVTEDVYRKASANNEEGKR